MKTILVPIDFSVASDNAALFAQELANSTQSRMTFLYVRQLYPFFRDNPKNKESDEIDFDYAPRQNMINFCNQVKETAVKSCDYIINQGDPTEEIKKVMDEKEPYLTIIGIRNKTALKWIFFGSVTLELIRKAQFPLLIIPEKAKFKPWKKIVFATDYHDNDFQSIRILCQFGRKFDSEITIVHVSSIDGRLEPLPSYLTTFKKELKKHVHYKKLMFKILEDNNIEKELDTFIQDNQIDIMALSRVERDVFTKILVPSTTKKMLYHTEIPLFVFHAEDYPSEDF